MIYFNKNLILIKNVCKIISKKKVQRIIYNFIIISDHYYNRIIFLINQIF